MKSRRATKKHLKKKKAREKQQLEQRIAIKLQSSRPAPPKTHQTKTSRPKSKNIPKPIKTHQQTSPNQSEQRYVPSPSPIQTSNNHQQLNDRNSNTSPTTQQHQQPDPHKWNWASPEQIELSSSKNNIKNNIIKSKTTSSPPIISQPKLSEFPQIILPIGIQFPTNYSRSYKVQNINDVVRSIQSKSSIFITITLSELLEHPTLGLTFWKYVSSNRSKQEQLVELFKMIYRLSLFKIQKRNTTCTSTSSSKNRTKIRILLCDFDTLGSKDIQLLKEILIGDYEKDNSRKPTIQFRLGLFILDADRDRFQKKYIKALKEENKNNVVNLDHVSTLINTWYSNYNSIVAKFKQSDMIRVTRMCECGRITEQFFHAIFGKTNPPMVEYDNDNEDDDDVLRLIESSTQTSSHGEKERGDMILKVSASSGGSRPLPLSALQQHTSPYTYAGKSTGTVTGTASGTASGTIATSQSLSLPQQTNQAINSMDEYHKYLGWLSVLNIESGHPDDWDRTFSNAYLFGKIISTTDTTFSLSQMKTGYSSNSKNHNWVLLQDGFKNLQIKVALKLCTASKKSSTGSAILILKKLYLQLHDKQTNRMLPRLSGSENFGGNGTRSLWQREQISMLQRTERLGM